MSKGRLKTVMARSGVRGEAISSPDPRRSLLLNLAEQCLRCHGITSIVLALALLAAVPATHGDRELPEIKPEKPLHKATDFQLADLHGVRVRLSEIDAPIVVLHFWTNDRDSKYDLELLQRLHAKYASRNVKFIGLAYNSGTREELAEFVSSLNVEFPTLMCSSEVRNDYDVSTFPTTFLLNKDKQIRYWLFGHLTERHWDQLIRELIDEQSKPISAKGSD